MSGGVDSTDSRSIFIGQQAASDLPRGVIVFSAQLAFTIVLGSPSSALCVPPKPSMVFSFHIVEHFVRKCFMIPDGKDLFHGQGYGMIAVVEKECLKGWDQGTLKGNRNDSERDVRARIWKYFLYDWEERLSEIAAVVPVFASAVPRHPYFITATFSDFNSSQDYEGPYWTKVLGYGSRLPRDLELSSIFQNVIESSAKCLFHEIEDAAFSLPSGNRWGRLIPRIADGALRIRKSPVWSDHAQIQLTVIKPEAKWELETPHVPRPSPIVFRDPSPLDLLLKATLEASISSEEATARLYGPVFKSTG
ncbi:hypothetical protein B0H19DRAFT_1072051 [Mycena capillaripes]|nr:hypothetical protein B0H19DRAFT_1072051 [Mycena capillaripes]